MRFFGLKTCDTCRKALKELAAAGILPELVDIRDPGLAAADRQAIVAALGAGVVNRASTTWRGLSAAEQALDPVELLTRHPTVMKRPVIEQDGKYTMGWTPAVRAVYLG